MSDRAVWDELQRRKKHLIKEEKDQRAICKEQLKVCKEVLDEIISEKKGIEIQLKAIGKAPPKVHGRKPRGPTKGAWKAKST